MRILVIGGTGNIGRVVVNQLADGGVEVRAMVRNPEAAGLPRQVEAVRGDITVPETLDSCLEGIETVFLLWTAPAATAEAVLGQIAKQARRIVYLSAPIKTPHPLFQASQPNRGSLLNAHIEQLIENSGLEWTFLRPGMFALNACGWWGAAIRAGEVVRWPYLDVPTAPIDERDIAAVAVRALREEGHAGAEYVLTGPESLSQAEQLATIGQVIGRTLQIEEMTPDEAGSELASVLPGPVAGYLLKSWAAAKGQPAFVTSTVEEVTGTPARTFLEWAGEHAAAFRRTHR